MCNNAAKNGHLKLLEWAVDNGCPEHEPEYESDGNNAYGDY